MERPTSTYAPLLLDALVAVLCVFLFVGIRHISDPRKRLPLPPGPKRLPLLGNVLDLPAFYQWITFTNFSKKLDSDILYFNMFGHDIIVLNSLEAAIDLLDKRSSIYSSRPRMPMGKELCGWDKITSVIEYGAEWRGQRKALHRHFHITASRSYIKLQTLEARKMMHRLLSTPENFREHIKHMTNSTILRIGYGIKTKEHNDPYLTITDEALEGVVATGIPGSFLVDVFPCLLYVPSWFPGAGFKRKAKKWRQAAMAFLNVPLEAAKASRGNEDGYIPVAVRMLEDIEDGESPEAVEERTKFAVGTAYLGGSDTSVSTMTTFFLAMALYPEAQKKAQAEVDALIGPGRMPEYEDHESLPYVQALTKECLRWQLVLPLAVAHSVTEEDEYRGYRIPRGAVVFGNSWAIMHDEKHYTDPHTFRPERFLKDGKLDPDVLDPTKAVFGFGRRLCPGRHMAMNNLHISFMTILACFNITRAQDRYGKDVPIEVKMAPGLISHPEDFQCSIMPRSERTAERINGSIQEMNDM